MLGPAYFPWFYLALALAPCLGCLGIWLLRPDLGRTILVTGLIGGAWEALSELVYLQDYWQPPTVLPWPSLGNGLVWPLPEDLLYGFGTTGIMATILPLVLGMCYNRRLTTVKADSHRFFVLVFFVAIAFASVVYIAYSAGLSSIWAATLAYAAIGAISLSTGERPGLWLLGAAAAVAVGALSWLVYAVALNLVGDGQAYLQQAWVPYGTQYGWQWLGVPVDEVAWNAARAWFVVLVYMSVSFQDLTPEGVRYRKPR